jgi:hypothetical protein
VASTSGARRGGRARPDTLIGCVTRSCPRRARARRPCSVLALGFEVMAPGSLAPPDTMRESPTGPFVEHMEKFMGKMPDGAWLLFLTIIDVFVFDGALRRCRARVGCAQACRLHRGSSRWAAGTTCRHACRAACACLRRACTCLNPCASVCVCVCACARAPTRHPGFSQKYGTTAKHFAKIGEKNHAHSVNNPYAQFQKKFTCAAAAAHAFIPWRVAHIAPPRGARWWWRAASMT